MTATIIFLFLLFTTGAISAPVISRHVKRSASDDEGNENPAGSARGELAKKKAEVAEGSGGTETEENTPLTLDDPNCFFAIPRNYANERHKRVPTSQIKSKCSGELQR
jgi:hypothetical protein